MCEGEPWNCTFDSSAWDSFEEITLVPAIARARKAGLIDEQNQNSLRAFAKELRNRYSHFNIQKITQGAVFEQVRERNIETGQENIIQLFASQTPTLQIIAKNKIDELSVIEVFEFSDRVVQHLFVMLSRK